MLHGDHPWLGRDVEDTVTGRRGTLRAIAPEGEKLRLVAWLRPLGGGVEWTTDPNALADPAPITPDTHPAS